MVMRLISLFFGCLGVIHAKQYPVKLGDTTVMIIQEKHGRGKNFVHLHQNETTALAAARTVIKKHGGSVLTLKHPGGRNIVFGLQNKRYEFDPNRIFTENGIKKSLNEFSEYTPQAQAEVEKLAYKIKALLPRGKVIAVHNNETYSLKDYLPGSNLTSDARHVHVNQDHYFRNFFFVTQATEYNRLMRLNFNSILQASNVTDDGSLSVLLSQRDYVNVEAGFDQLNEQIKMLMHA